jgi:hypothetical protein
MAQLNNLTNSSASDQWQLPVEILASTSPQVTNNNQFTYPRITTDGNLFYLLFNANVGEGLTTSSTGSSQIGTVTNKYYYLMQSANLIDFSYPLPLYSAGGTTIYADTAGVSFVNQNANYFILGNGKNWQYIKNNIVADITNYVISYNIQEVAGQSSQISLVLGNANNYWIGSGAAGVGNAAIAVNKKIILEQGYKTVNGKEVAPRNVFYIDTITLNSSATDNTASIQGRDINRNLQNVSTKFSYSINGPSYYNDLFDGTTLQNWSIQNGTWIETGNLLENSSPSGNVDVIQQGQINNSLESAIIFTMFDSPSSGEVVIYPMYVDAQNFYAISITNNGGTLNITFTLVVNNSAVSGYPISYAIGAYAGGRIPIFIRKYNYFSYDVMIGSPYGSAGVFSYPDNVLDPVGSYATFYPLTNTINTNYTNTNFLVNGSVALGTQNAAGNFGPFKFMQFSDSLSLQEAMEYLCAIAGITNFDPRVTFFDNQYLTANWSGAYSIQNSYMSVSPSIFVMNTSNPFQNGSIEFTAKAVPVVSGTPYAFSFVFRSTNTNVPSGNAYQLLMANSGTYLGLPICVATLELSVSGTNIVLSQSSVTTTTNLIPIDMTQFHTYRISMIDQLFYFFIDERVYMMWHDTNSTLQLNSSGYWGVSAKTNTNLTIGNFTSYALYTQLPNVSFNPGDDMTSILQNVLETMFAYSYTDQLGRYIGLTLNATDPSDYIYQNLLYTMQSQGVSSSVINEVIVTGSGVIATYKDTALIAEIGQIRSMSITDYTITTYQDALVRAENELISNNSVAAQNNPNNPMNVGSEMFDVITLINTGNNSVSINGNYRLFNQTFTLDGSKGSYSIQIETGNL